MRWFFAAGLVAVPVGFLVRRWWLLPTVLVAGIGAIVLDVSTRDLTGGGHDDRLLVAIAEAVGLVFVVLGTAGGIAAGRTRITPQPLSLKDQSATSRKDGVGFEP